MTRITEDLIRKRAEHNECVIATLEELSLHQQDIERIEYLDKWCRDLKILYLQSNLIPKIENVSRLKKLEYLNLALNNIEKIENLEGCESLKKLDLTVNFVGELTSIKSLKNLIHLKELYLTGNPCTEYDGYRQYVIAVLPQLQMLDGQEVGISERILAVQALPEIQGDILRQQEAYRQKREKQRLEEADGKTKKDDKWYTDTTTTRPVSDDETKEEKEKTEEEIDKEFWEEKTPYTPESRIRVHKYMEEKKKKEERKVKGPDVPPRVIRLQTDDGRMLNVNEAKIGFELRDDEEENTTILDVAVYKHLDTSLCDVDVQPTYVRVTIKGKVLQLVLQDEVKPDSSTAKRSQITGHLVITMPKAREVVKPVKQKENIQPEPVAKTKDSNTGPQKLEVDPTLGSKVNLDIIKENEMKLQPKIPLLGSKFNQREIPERENSEDFVDDPDVPPLV